MGRYIYKKNICKLELGAGTREGKKIVGIDARGEAAPYSKRGAGVTLAT